MECGLLIDASAQSVYNWESGKARPRESHMTALGVLKKLGKRAAAPHELYGSGGRARLRSSWTRSSRRCAQAAC